MDEAFRKIQMYGRDYREALALADDRKERIISLIDAARTEGYSMEAIAHASGLSRQTLYTRGT